jgi:hypothetical protein
VLDDEVEEDADTGLLGLLQQFDDVGQGPEPGVDTEVVGDVVAAVAVRGVVERQDPQAGDTEAAEVVEAVGDAAQVAPSVPGGVAVHGGVDGVDHGIAVPERLHGAPIGPVSVLFECGGGCPRR